ncbi:hypothetical protein PINS_up013372 [Pythium insidiosum]|nr:hypothetical protein PINS_up013372 [Pythium insidiosum]
MLDVRETLSGVVGAFGCVYAGLPFEVVKVRLQTQGEPKTYTGVAHAFRRIATEEGVVSLWKGAVPALSSSIIENSVLFSVNGIARRSVLALHAGRKVATDAADYELTTLDEALMGGISGVFSATVRLCSERPIGFQLTRPLTRQTVATNRRSRPRRSSSASCSTSAAVSAKEASDHDAFYATHSRN